MTKIKETSPKSHTQPPREVKEIIDAFASCPDDELTARLSEFTRWEHPKGDLNHWIAPLNRFDDILENAVKDHGFREGQRIQLAPFSPEFRETLCQVMRVTILLFHNCSYRTIYASASHIYDLLGSTDLDVLENALRLITCFAARTAQRPDPTNPNFVLPKNRLWKFATCEGLTSRQPPFPDLKSLLSPQISIPPNWAGYHFHYYKKAPATSLTLQPQPRFAGNSQFSPVTPTPKSRDSGEPSHRDPDSSTSSDTKTTEGWVRLHLSPDLVRSKGIELTFRELVAQAQIPKDDQYRLFVQILMVYYFHDENRREQFLRCQLAAISALANVCDSSTMEKQLYSTQPEIIPQLVRLLHNDSEAGINLKTMVLRTLRTLARNSLWATNRRSEHSRFQQVLNAVDSNLNHGILMTLLRENTSLLQSRDPTSEELQYTQALHRLIREFLEAPQGASNLGFAGIMPVLVDITKIERPSVWHIVVTMADLLGGLLPHQRYNQLLPLFIDADGLNTTISLIKRHVDQPHAKPAEGRESGPGHSKLTYAEHQSIHTFLNLLMKILKMGHGERVRAVVDSPVITSLRVILEDLPLFGGIIGALASKILALIIHHEPTSYSALHENGLPQAFLTMISTYIPPSPELILAIPNVFDAICINNQGKELFAQHNFEGFFRIFSSLEHCKVMTQGHCASDSGAAIDEVVRHHPDLKDTLLKSYIQMLQDVIGNLVMHEKPVGLRLPELVDISDSAEAETEVNIPSTLNSGSDLILRPVKEERNSPVLLLARNVLLFSEGLFSTAHWVKEFVREDGHKLLLNILRAPALPVDYADTRDGVCLRGLISLFAEQFGPNVIPDVLTSTREIVTKIDVSPVSLPSRYITEEGLADIDLNTLNPYLRLLSPLLSHLSILHSIYMQTTNMQGRPNPAYTLPFGQQENVDMLGTLGKIVRDCYSKGNELLRSLPKKYKDALPLQNTIEDPRRRSQVNELSDENFLKKYGFPRRSILFRNIELLQLFIGLIPRRTQRFFAGLSNSLVSRSKLSDPNQRNIAVAVLDKISDVFLDLVSHSSDPSYQPINRFINLFGALTFTHNTLTGGTEQQASEKNPQAIEKNLQTLLLNRFKLKGGLEALLNVMNGVIDELPQCDKDDKDEAQTKLIVGILANLRLCFAIIRLFTMASHIGESPQTAFLSSRDRYKDQGNYFVLSTFISESRAAALPVLTRILPYLNKLEKTTAHYFLFVLCEILLGGPEEYHSEANKYEGEPDEESINRLCQLGFDRALAYSALMSNGNIEEIAKDYLISRREARTTSQNEESMPALVEGEELEQHEPITMEVDAPSQDVGLGSSVSNAKPEFKETAMETLAGLRTAFSNDLENYITDILIYHPELPFDLCKLIKSVSKWESKEWLQDKLLELAARLASLEDDKATKAKEITACAHVLGLLLSEPRYFKSAESTILGFLDSFVGFLKVEPEQEAPWLSPVSLIIETIIRESDYVQMRHQAAGLPREEAVPEIDTKLYGRLVDNLVSILESNPSDETVVLCTLRLLVRLTRDGQWARRFREVNGISALLKVVHRHVGKPALKLFDSSIVIIRNIVEDDKIILATIRSSVMYALEHSGQRGRPIELSELIRNKHADVLRNPALFSQAVTQVAKLHQWSSTSPGVRRLTKKQTESATEGANENDKDNNADANKDAKSSTLETPRKPTLELNYTSGVVQILLTELLSHHSEASAAPKDASNATTSTNKPADSTNANGTSTSANRSKLSPEELRDYHYTLFLLLTLSELLASYNNCKVEFVNYSRRGQPREPLTPSKPRSTMLNYLLNDLLPTGNASYSIHTWGDLSLEKRKGISLLAANVISALCKKTPESYENDDRPDLLPTVRKFVLEGIARLFKDTLASNGPAQIKYGRFTALAELCRKLLVSQPLVPLAVLQAEVTGTADIAKLMFEKGFIGLLTSVVADIELDFPDVRGVVNDILTCLRDLTASINRLSANAALDVSTTTGDIDEISIASSVSDDEMQERDETPDVFQNSALGIMQGVVEDEDGHDEYDEYDEEMEYDEEDDDDEDDGGGLNRSGSESEEDDDDDEDEMVEDHDDMHVGAVEIIMEEEGDEESASEDDEDIDEEADDADDQGSDGQSIIDMLEEQQMQADQLNEADGWTTDTDSLDEGEGEEIDEEYESADDEPHPMPSAPLPLLDEDEMDFSEEDLDGELDAEEVREMIGHLEGHLFDPLQEEDDEDEEEHMHRHDWFLPARTQTIRHGGGIQFRGGMFNENRTRTINRRSIFPQPPASTAGMHPMLVNNQAPPQQQAQRGIANHIPQLGNAPPDLLRSMEQLFGMQNMLTELMDQLGDGQQTTISFELRSNTNGQNMMPRIVRMQHQVGGHRDHSPDEHQHPLKTATELVPLETTARWQQAASLWYQNAAQERAMVFENMIFKLLEPAAIEDEKERKIKEEADRKAAEEARKAREEEEHRLAEEAAAREKAEAEQREREEAEAQAREEARRAEEEAERQRIAAEALIESAHAIGTDVMGEVETNAAEPEVGTSESTEGAPAQETESATVERVYTTIRGNRVDITGLGVDPEFLEALPEDMREEVLYQHIRDRRAAAPPDQPSTLDPSFLDALPQDIRAELLAEEAAERRRQERAAHRQQEGQQPGPSGPIDLDPATFIASLEGPLRQAVLLDQDDDILAQLPPHIVAEATALRERVGQHRFGGLLTGQRAFTIGAELRRKPVAPKRKDGIQLLDKSGLATLVRLTFLRNRPEHLQDIFMELCRHRHTRIEVVSLLLSILQDGSADVAAVERSFSQLSVKAKGHDQAISPIKSKTKMDSNFISHISGENSPTLIARHCLELLNHLVKNNHSLPFYFLTEHESHQTLRRASSKKGKGKEVVTKESKYPINNLLSLLERSAILDTKASTEEFARLLADVTKPLLALLRKPKAGEKPAESTTPQNPAPPAAEATTAPTTTAPDTAPPATTEGGDAAPVEGTTTTVDQGTASSEKKEGSQPTRTLTPPVISEHNLELLVLILVAKEVSRETFRSTLATMHHLMAVPGALDVFGSGLAREAQRYADIAQSDLWNIAKKFEAAQAAGNLKDVDLTEYTSRGADQTKLLKIFKAIDYLFNRVQKEDGDGKENSHQGAIAIYSQLSLSALWENLSKSLTFLRDDPATWPLAQPLLPMIESLLVACNHINTRPGGKRISNPEAEQIESLFFQFTEEHRKILNYLVHMQPSLMSGSFEMLAHNPKVLEFDNKRNYFNRKLHDKKGQRVPTRAISLNIRRDMVFLDSFRSLCFRTGEEIKNARLNVRFQGEEGVDAGGLTREWYQVLARQMFDPNYALFTPVASDSATFHPNKSSYVNDEHLMFFKFVGRIIGKALYDGRLLDCHFSRAVYKHILSRPISVKDLEYYDNTYYKNLMWMLENEINDVVTETFSIEAEEYGVTHTIDLVPDGRNIPVTDENKAEYVRLVSEYKLQTSVKDQLKEFLTGFHDIIPAELVSIFTEQELELLISGLPDIDIEDWKAHTNYSNYEASSPQIQWFWRAVRAFTKEERAKLLQFATGTSKVPLNGFKALEGMQGTTKFTIVRDFGPKTRLPQSHTCFNQIDLPEYESYEQLRTALLTAITMGTEGFGFA